MVMAMDSYVLYNDIVMYIIKVHIKNREFLK